MIVGEQRELNTQIDRINLHKNYHDLFCDERSNKT